MGVKLGPCLLGRINPDVVLKFTIMKKLLFTTSVVTLQQRCYYCMRILLQQNKISTSLVATKEIYSLLHPRDEIVTIVTKCKKNEVFIKERFSSEKILLKTFSWPCTQFFP